MRRRDSVLVIAVLVLTVATLMSPSAYAQCTRSSNTKILAVNSTTALLYWYETCADNSSAVYYQRSTNGLNSWGAPRRLLSVSDGRSSVQSFDGIIAGGTTLLASFAIERPTGGARIYVKTSTDRGATWSATTLVRSFPGEFNGCPTLDSSYESRLGLFVLRTVIQNGDSAHVYVLTSPDGITWSSAQLGGSNYPSNCDDDG
jgi:hypothetical protein